MRRGGRDSVPRKAGPCVVVDLGSCTLKAGHGGIGLGAGWAPDVSVNTLTLKTPNRMRRSIWYIIVYSTL